MENWTLVAIVVAALWTVGVIGLRLGYRDGYHQAEEDRALYDAAAEADFWPGQEERE